MAHLAAPARPPGASSPAPPAPISSRSPDAVAKRQGHSPDPSAQPKASAVCIARKTIPSWTRCIANKAQQDALLPHGKRHGGSDQATTENPIQRQPPAGHASRIFQLKPLTEDDLYGIARQALADPGAATASSTSNRRRRPGASIQRGGGARAAQRRWSWRSDDGAGRVIGYR